MPFRLIGIDELRSTIGFIDLIDAAAEAFRVSSAGLAENGLIVMFPAESRAAGDVYVKTGAIPGHPIYIVKVSPWFAVNAESARPQAGFIAAFDARNGQTIAVLDDQHYLSDIRTAAAGGLVARLLAPPQVDTALLLGSGTQAFWQPQALYRERKFERLLVWARNPQKAASIQDRLRAALPEVAVELVPDIETAVRASDAIITATQSKEPLIRGEWLRPGQHITAIGADDSTKAELDSVALQRARVFVDTRTTAEANGEVHRAIERGDYAIEDVAGEIGEILSGVVTGRHSAEEITIATLAGIGAQDLLTTEIALARLGLLGPDAG